MRIGALWQEMYRSQYFEGGRVLQAAISAIDIALHDIKGKALGVPVYELLGGKQRDRIPTFATHRRRRRTEIVASRRQRADGARLERDPPLPRRPDSNGHLRAARQHRRDRPRAASRRARRWATASSLGIDYHHRLSVAEAASFCQKMPSGTLDFLEEPIRDETPEAYEALRTDDRHALRHRRGVRLASGSSCPTSSAASTSSTGSTSAMSAASPRR